MLEKFIYSTISIGLIVAIIFGMAYLATSGRAPARPLAYAGYEL